MATTKEEVDQWIREVNVQGATHLISVCDMFDWTDYPVYVKPGESVHYIKLMYNDRSKMSKVNEVIILKAASKEKPLTELEAAIKYRDLLMEEVNKLSGRPVSDRESQVALAHHQECLVKALDEINEITKRKSEKSITEILAEEEAQWKPLSELHKSPEDCRAIFVAIVGLDWYERVNNMARGKQTTLIGRHLTQIDIWDNGDVAYQHKGAPSEINIFDAVSKFRELKYKPEK